MDLGGLLRKQLTASFSVDLLGGEIESLTEWNPRIWMLRTKTKRCCVMFLTALNKEETLVQWSNAMNELKKCQYPTLLPICWKCETDSEEDKEKCEKYMENCVVRLEGKFGFVLYDLKDYEFLKSPMAFCESDKRLKFGAELGALLGRLHAIPLPTDVTMDQFRNSRKIYGMIQDLHFRLKSTPPATTLDDSGAKKIIDFFEKGMVHVHSHFMLSLPEALIHCNIIPDNILTNKEGSTVLGIAGFEEAGRGFRVMDLGIAIAGCCFSPSCSSSSTTLPAEQKDNHGWNEGLARAILCGYAHHVKLTSEESSVLPHFVLFGTMALAARCFKRFHWNDQKFVPATISQVEKSKYLQIIHNGEYLLKCIEASRSPFLIYI